MSLQILGDCFFYGYGGTCKTFLWRTIFAAFRFKGEIVLTMSSSIIDVLLILSGRITHSRFHIAIKFNEDSTYIIKKGNPLAELISLTHNLG